MYGMPRVSYHHFAQPAVPSHIIQTPLSLPFTRRYHFSSLIVVLFFALKRRMVSTLCQHLKMYNMLPIITPTSLLPLLRRHHFHLTHRCHGMVIVVLN